MARVRKGDTVLVVRGNDKGKRGKVTRVLPEQNKVVVEGINMVKKHLKALPERPGGILEVEAPIAASNVMPVDPETGRATRVRVAEKDGKKVRIAKSGAEIVAES